MTKERKNYVLDTNVILHDPLSFFNFKNATIFIPFIVIYELDKLKKDSAERGYHARQAIRILEDLRKTANLVEGVPIKGNSIVKVVVADEFSDKAPDDYILHVTLKLKAEYPNITLVTKDFNLRIKADTFKINVEDYQEEIITKDSFYKGWRELEVSNHDLKNNLDKIMPQLHEENPFNINEFILFKNSYQDYNYRIFRHTGDNKFQEASYHAKVLWQLMPKNPYQAMVIDLLMDDSIPLVILCGPSGTGKTFLVLACLLYKVIVANVYQRLLVSRPLVPLGPDIGFLPGDLQEKLQTWMQPIKDNLDFLVHHINQHQVGNPSN
ncbi:MAG: PhoH family protein, partial [Silvanigrellaceae bacterium]|nr:PhoH family protein [Silvanigrellaceae bacterium]